VVGAPTQGGNVIATLGLAPQNDHAEKVSTLDADILELRVTRRDVRVLRGAGLCLQGSFSTVLWKGRTESTFPTMRLAEGSCTRAPFRMFGHGGSLFTPLMLSRLLRARKSMALILRPRPL
jgi:hypothetical protein